MRDANPNDKGLLKDWIKQHIQTWCPYLARLEVVPGLGA
jgi:hypothetical protein